MIILNLHLRTADQRQPSGVAHALTLCVIPKPVSIEIYINEEFYYIIAISSACFLFLALLMTFCMFTSIHRLIRPLR